MKLKDVIRNIEVLNIYGDTELDICHITNNSRECIKGSLFAAVRGFQTDGHKYIPSAVQNGASAILCEEYIPGIECTQIVVSDSRRFEAVAAANFYGNPCEKLKLIGVTGTNGKTTVTYLVKHILEECGFKTALIGTNQNMIGSEVIETGRTTPDSIELQSLFARMANEKVDFCVMEVSSHALELDRVYGCRYTVGAFTNLTQDHLDFHKTMDNYAKAKFKLFEISDGAVINGDDEYGAEYVNKCKCKTLAFGVKNDNNSLLAENIVYTSKGVTFDVGRTSYSLAIPGEFSVYNALCAIGIAKLAGIDDEKISAALSGATGVKGRAEVVLTDTDYTVIIDYAHTPDGIENILKAVRTFTEGKLTIVFGCGGDRDSTKRPIMGRAAGELADFCVVTSDNPRTENPSAIIKMVEEGVKESGCDYIVIESRKDAIAYALEHGEKGDVIVLAGKGHETYQILGTGTIHFDEREVVKEILSARGK